MPSRLTTGTGILRSPAKKRPVTERGSGKDVFQRSAGHHLSPVLARPRAHVHDVVGAAHGLLVVLDHDHGVAQVAQAKQRLDEPAVVALVQADGGLVEDVEDAHQTGAYLGRQADTLGLPPGERAGGAIETEVTHSHGFQERQPFPYLLQHPGCR